jgi:hypothetical protein
MAGKRQHYLPQFLQRGFASDVTGKRIWLYRKNAAPREVGTRDVGVEENFYGSGTDTLVDEAITAIERDEFVTLIEEARAGTISESRLANVMPTFVAHLEVRTRHIRVTFSELSERAWNDMMGYVANPAVGAAIVRERLRRYPGELRKLAARDLRSKGQSVHLAPIIAKQMQKMVSAMPDDVLIKAFWAPLVPLIQAALKEQMDASIKKAHIKALAESVTPHVRVGKYRDLKFSVVDLPSHELILGDAAVLFELNEPGGWKPFLDEQDNLAGLYLPLRPNRLIIGRSNSAVIDAETIRRETARTSHTFFVSSKPSEANAKLSEQIGAAARPMTDDQLRDIGRGVIAELLPSTVRIEELLPPCPERS